MEVDRRKSMRRGMPMASRAPLEATVAGTAVQKQGQTGESQGELPAVVLSKLTKSDFQAEEYLKETLKTVQEKSIRQFRKTLEDARKAASKNLQKNV
ncbi:hypothetical protein EV174_007130, partial [Coemansia sp. RSA 2320]